MTTTIIHLETHELPARTDDSAEVLDTLRATVVAVGELDPDLLHSHTPAGRAVVTLAAAARGATAALGAEAGTSLRTAAGVVVVRDLVAAVSLLELARSRTDAPSTPRALQEIRRRADAAYARLLFSAPSAI